MNSIKKKDTKKFKNIDSDDDNLIEELEAFSAIENSHKDTSKNTAKKNSSIKQKTDSKNVKKKSDPKKNTKKKDTKKKSDTKKKDTKKKDTKKKSDPKNKDIKKKPDVKKNAKKNSEPKKKESKKFKVDTDDKHMLKKKKKNDNGSDSDSDSDSNNDSDSSEYENNNDAVMLTNAVKKWVFADDRQREIRKTAIEKKKENDKLNSIKKETSGIITKAMADDDLPKITISKGKLLLNKSTSKEKYSSEVIEAALTKKYPKKKVDEIIDMIENEREDIVKYNIKRVGN